METNCFFAQKASTILNKCQESEHRCLESSLEPSGRTRAHQSNLPTFWGPIVLVKVRNSQRNMFKKDLPQNPPQIPQPSPKIHTGCLRWVVDRGSRLSSWRRAMWWLHRRGGAARNQRGHRWEHRADPGAGTGETQRKPTGWVAATSKWRYLNIQSMNYIELHLTSCNIILSTRRQKVHAW